MSYYHPYIKGSQQISNGLIADFNSNTVGNLYTTSGNVGINTTAPNSTLDVSGNINASNNISSTRVSAGSIGVSGATVSTLYATTITSGSVQASGTVSAATITSGSVQASGTVSAATFVGTLVSSGSIATPGATVGTLYATAITSANAQMSGTVSAATLVGSLVSAGSIGAAGATVGTLYATTITSANAQMSGTISAGSIVSSFVSAGSIGASGATVGTLYATTITSANAQISGTISAATHVGSLFSAGSIGAAGATVGTLYASTITSANAQMSGTVSAANIVGSIVSAGSIAAPGATIGTVYTNLVSSANAQITGSVTAGTVVGTNVRATSMSVGGLVMSGATALNDNHIYFRGPGDTYQGIGYNQALDGPQIYGYAGGALGHKGTGSFVNSLTWNSSGVSTSNIRASGTVSSATYVGSLVSAGSVGAAGITTGTLYASNITVGNLYVSGYTVSMNMTTLNMIDTNVTAGSIIAGNISAGNMTVGNLYNNGSMLIGRTSTTTNWDAGESCLAISATEGSSRAVILLGNDPTTATKNWHIVNELNSVLTFYNGNYGSGAYRMGLNNAGDLSVSNSVNVGNVSINTTSITASNLLLNTTNDVPAINPDAFNTLMVYEDMQGAALRSGTLLGSATFDATNDYVQLTSNTNNQDGTYYWNMNPGNSFSVNFELYVGGGTIGAADQTTFYVNTSSGAGYNVKFTEYAGSLTKGISLSYNTTLLANYPDISWANSAWHKIKIIFFRNQFRILLNNNLVINYFDTTDRALTGGNTMGFNAWTGGENNYHRIRNIRISKFTEGLWSFDHQTSANVVYNGGNVGINTTAPSYTLDVGGTIAGSLVTTANIASSRATIGNMISTNATFSNMISTNATIGNVISTTVVAGSFTGSNMILSGSMGSSAASIGNLFATTISAGTLAGSLVTTANVTSSRGTIGNLLSSNTTISNLISSTATIGGIIASDASVGTLVASSNVNVLGTISSSNLQVSSTVSAATITSANVQISGTISAATHVGSLFSAGSIGVAGATVGTLYASTITSGNIQVSGSISSGRTYAKAGNPQLNIYHTTPGNETSVYYDAGTVASHWYVGQNVGAVGRGSFALFNSNVGTVMTLLSAGNVGIGTTTPGYKLDVSGDINFTGNLRKNGSIYNGGTSSQWTTTAGNISYTSGSVVVGSTISAGTMLLAPSATISNIVASSVSTGTIVAGGNMTLSRTKMISTSPDDAFIYSNNTVGHYSLGWNGDEATAAGDMAYLAGYGGIRFFSAGVPRMVVQFGGNVGINTTSPGYTLDVNGTAAASTFVGTLVSAGSVGAAGITTGTLYSTNATATSATIGTVLASTVSSGSAWVSGTSSINTVSSGSVWVSGTSSINTVSSGSVWVSGTSSINTVSSGSVWVSGTVSATLATAGSMGAAGITAGTLYSTNATATNATISNIVASTGLTAGTIVAGTITAGNITSANIGATFISAASMLVAPNIVSSSGLTAGTVVAGTITAGNITASRGTIGNLLSSNTTISNLISSTATIGGIIASDASVGTLVASSNVNVWGTIGMGAIVRNQSLSLYNNGTNYYGFGANDSGIIYNADYAHYFYNGSTVAGGRGTLRATINTSGISSSNLQVSSTVVADTVSVSNIVASSVSTGTIVAGGNMTLSRTKMISTSPGDAFIYSNNTVGHYSLGWNGDEATAAGDMAYLTGYGGIRFFSAGVPRMVVQFGGNVGINTTSPGYTLDVNGTAAASTFVGTLVSAGSVGAAGITTGTLYANTITVGNLYVSGYTISMNVTAVNLIQTNISAGNATITNIVASTGLTAGTIVAGTITAGNITSANIGATFISAASMLVAPNIVSSSGLTAGSIVAGNISAGNMTVGNLYNNGSVLIGRTSTTNNWDSGESCLAISAIEGSSRAVILLGNDATTATNNWHIVKEPWSNADLVFYNGNYGSGSNKMSINKNGDLSVSNSINASMLVAPNIVSSTGLTAGTIVAGTITAGNITSANIGATFISAGTMLLAPSATISNIVASTNISAGTVVASNIRSTNITASSVYINTTNDVPAINPDAFNTLIVYEDMQGTSLRSGTLIGDATFDATDDYVQLTPATNSKNGTYYWDINPGNSFSLDFELYVGGGTGADYTTFYWNTNGYSIIFDEYPGSPNKGISVRHNYVILSRLDDTTWADSTWHKIRLVFFRNQFRVYVDNSLKINYLDTTTRTLSGNVMGFNSGTGGANNNHRIRNIRISKFTEGLWSYVGQTSPNIMFNGGNVGVNTITPGYTLDVGGDINFTGSLRQNGTLYNLSALSSQWTTTDGNVSYTTGSVVVRTTISAGTMIASPSATIGNIVASTGLTAGTIVAGTVTAGTITASNIGAPVISAGTMLLAPSATISNVVSTNISAGTIIAGTITAGTITASNIGAPVISAGTMLLAPSATIGNIRTTSVSAGGLVMSGVTALNDNHMYFRGPSDTYHGIGYNGSVDGPQIYGYAGGALGYKSSGTFANSLTWNSSGVSTSNLYSTNMYMPSRGTLYLANGSIGQEANAGKIGYQLFSSSLDIVGAGTISGSRNVRIYDNLITDVVSAGTRLLSPSATIGNIVATSISTGTVLFTESMYLGNVYHGLAYNGDSSINGPMLYGYAGGALACIETGVTVASLKWNSGGISTSNLRLSGGITSPSILSTNITSTNILCTNSSIDNITSSSIVSDYINGLNITAGSIYTDNLLFYGDGSVLTSIYKNMSNNSLDYHTIDSHRFIVAFTPVALLDVTGISTSNLRSSGITSASILSTDITSTNILTTGISAGTMSFGVNAISIVLNGNDKVINFTGGSVGYNIGKNMGGGAMNTTLPNHFGIQMRSTAGAGGGIYLGSTGTVHLSAGLGATTGSLICTNSIVDNITSVNIVNSNITTAALKVSGTIDFGYYYSSKSIGLFNDGGSNYAGIGFNNSGSLAYQVPLSTKHEFFYASTPSSDGISVAIIDNTGISTSNLRLSGRVTCASILSTGITSASILSTDITSSNILVTNNISIYDDARVISFTGGSSPVGYFMGKNMGGGEMNIVLPNHFGIQMRSTAGAVGGVYLGSTGTLHISAGGGGVTNGSLLCTNSSITTITTNSLVANTNITIMGDNKPISFTTGTVGYNVGTNLQGGSMHTTLPGHFAIQGRTPGAAGLYLGSTGTLHIASSGVTNGSLICTNITTANVRTTALTVGSTSYTSDARLKTDIMPLSDALSTIAQLKPSSYRMKFNLDDEFVDDKINYGLIAQDVYKVVPQLVYGNTSGSNTLGLDYNSLFVLTMKALQELTEEHNKLKEDFENFCRVSPPHDEN